MRVLVKRKVTFYFLEKKQIRQALWNGFEALSKNLLPENKILFLAQSNQQNQ